MNEHNKLNVGKDSVVIGNVSGNVGDGSVIIGATDANGNTIINNDTLAIGRGAFAGPGSIAIGAGANAGSEIAIALNQLNTIIQNTNDPKLIQSFTSFCSCLDNPTTDKSILKKLWEGIKTAASLDGAISLTNKISDWLNSSM